MGCDLCGASVEGGDGAVGWTGGHNQGGRTQVRQRQELWRTWSIRIASRVKDGCGLYCYQASWFTELLASTVKL